MISKSNVASISRGTRGSRSIAISVPGAFTAVGFSGQRKKPGASVAERGRLSLFNPIDEDRRARQDHINRSGRSTYPERISVLTTGATALVEQFVHRKLRAERWDAKMRAWVRDPKAKTKARKRPDAAAGLLGYADRNAEEPKRRRSKVLPTFLSQLGQVKAVAVSKRQLIDFLDSIVDRGAPVHANRVHALLKQLFAWGAAKDLIPASPMAGVERPGGDETPRDRVLTADEIRNFWIKMDGAHMAEPTKLALKLLLATAQRRGEITFAKWSHFDLDAKVWTIPVELLKNSHATRMKAGPHAVPISSLALGLLEQLKAITGDGLYLLPAHTDKKKDAPYSERVLSRAVRMNADHFAIAHFTPHDLRRTAASFMTKNGTPRLHVEKVLNHATGDIAEVYDRHDYLPEKRAALERWGSRLSEITTGRTVSNVTTLHHRATA